MSSTVGTSTSAAALAYPHQRKDFYANGRFWVFWSNGTNLVYATSTDGTTWSSATSVRACTLGLYFSVWFDGTYLHYAYAAGASIYYRRGTPNSDGTITWSAVEQTVATTYSKANYPMVSADSNGYVWIGYNDYDGTNHYPFVIKSGNKDGTWGTTPTGFPYQLSTTSASYWVATPVPLTSGKMLIVYAYDGSSIYAKRWNGSAWGTEVATGNIVLMGIYHSAVAQGDDVHIAFFTSGNYIIYVKYTYSTNSFGTETTLQTTASGIYAAPNICIDTATNNLYVFWAGYPTANHIYYRKYTASTSTWETAVNWITETSLSANDKIRCFYQSYGNYIGVIYTTGTASPYSVKFAYLTLVTAVTVTVTDSVGLSDAALCDKTFVVGDSVGLVDVPLKGWTPTVTDVVTLLDAVLRNKAFSVLDSVGLADAALCNKQFAVQDALSLLDAILSHKQLRVSDTISLADVALVLKTLLLTDTISLSDVVNVLLLGVVQVFDSIGVADSVKIDKSLAVQDVLALLDEVKRNKQLTITDVVFAIEAVLVGKMFAVSDSVHATDAVSRSKLLSILDAVGLSDVIFCDKQLIISDVAHVTETVLRNKVIELLDSVCLSDVVKVNKIIIVSDELALVELVSAIPQLPHVPFYLPIRLKVRKA